MTASTYTAPALVARLGFHWHRVDANNIWLFHARNPLELSHANSEDGPIERKILSAITQTGSVLQRVIRAVEWQETAPVGNGRCNYSPVSCVFARGFKFAGFGLARPNWEPGK